MGATLTITESTNEMIRLVGDQLVQETSQQNLYVVPPAGEYEFMITGYALPFQMRKQPQHIRPGESEFATKTRIEFTITEGKGKGKMFTDLYTFSLGAQAHLGNLLRRLKVNLEPNARGEWDLDNAIGYVGKGYVTASEKLDENTGKPKYAYLAVDTVSPVRAPEKPYSIVIETREPVGSPIDRAAARHGNAPADDGWE
jgi:hypothetical protein